MTAQRCASASALLSPVPEDCTDSYAAGWAYGDWHIRKGGSLDADAPAGWHEEKVNGFWDRLSHERQRSNANATEEEATW